MGPIEIRTWALRGAEQRLLEIGTEARAIYAAFPELRDQNRGFESQTGANIEQPRRRRRRKMSAEARKRIGDAQRRRWAAWKAKNGTKGEPKETRQTGRSKR